MLKSKGNFLQSERIFWNFFGSFYDFFVFYIVDFFTECFLRVKVKVILSLQKKTNDRKKLSFAGRYSFEFVSKKILGSGDSSVVSSEPNHRDIDLIDSYFTEIRMGEGCRGGSGWGRATIIIAIIKVSLNLRGQAQLKSSHSLFQQVSLV